MSQHERTVKGLKRLARGEGRGDGKIFREEAEKAVSSLEAEESPWMKER